MPDLVIIRHEQSTYNLENRLTGCLDVTLSSQGIEEAKADAQKLKDYKFDVAFTFTLKRAIDTLQIILNASKNGLIQLKTKRSMSGTMGICKD